MSIGQFLFTFPYLRKAYIRAISTYTDIKGKILPTKNRFNIPVGGHDSHFVVLCYPQMPYAFHTISQICTYKGYTLTNKPQNADIVMFFEDETFLKPNKVIQDLAKKNTVVNYFCRDVSKLKIEQVHVSVFGYGLEINPLTFKGEYVKKSDANSLHLEKVLSKPENPHKGFVYQRLINNKVKENFQEMRLYIFADKIVYSYLILRPTNERFGNKHASIKITKPSELISSSEYKNVIRFCKKLGLDYGELDVIRDSDNKKLYIIDANHTPGGPPSNFPKKEIVPRLKILSNAFKQTFGKTIMKNIKVIKHKAIGLIGGMGPQASSYTYKMLIDLSVEHYGAKDSVDFPQIIIDSLPIPDFVSNVKNLGKAKKLIKASIRGFNKLDVSCLSLACNSAHMFIKELQNQTTIPFISMIDAVVNEVKKDKFRTVGIIGTPVIMRSTLYQNAFKKIGVKSIIPENTYFAILDKIIRKVVVGTNSASDSRTLAKIADLLIQNGAECIVLGCTEIPLAFPKTYKHKAYNSVEILCKALLRAYYDL